jgi:hypothetical protein
MIEESEDLLAFFCGVLKAEIDQRAQVCAVK